LDSSNSLAHDKSLSYQFAGYVMSKELYQHFATEDIPFIDKGLEWLRQVEEHYAPILTPFINPHQVFILETLGNNRGVKTFASTSQIPSEYARVILAPDYFTPRLEDFEMALLEIEYPSKFQQLTHSKILGTVLNRLGIDRKLFGDIIVTEEKAQIIVGQRFVTLFQDGIQKISKLPVRLEERPFSDIIESKNEYQEKEILVSSFRLDTFLSSILKLSRSQTLVLVEKKLVQVNYHIVEKSDYQVKVGDLISVRRFGRIILLKENGQTKKDKKKLTVQLLLSK
jgi:ylmH protein